MSEEEYSVQVRRVEGPRLRNGSPASKPNPFQTGGTSGRGSVTGGVPYRGLLSLVHLALDRTPSLLSA